MALSEFRFVTVLQDGHPGMGLVKDGQPQAFVPKLLGTHKDQLATFLGLGTTEFKQLTAAVSILDQLEAGQWAGFEFPKQFDLGFWRPSIKALTAQLKLLPVLLRYDDAKAGKVISITTKPVPKPKPKTAAKAKPAAPTV